MNANLHQPAMLMPSPDSAPQSNPGFSRMFARDRLTLGVTFAIESYPGDAQSNRTSSQGGADGVRRTWRARRAAA
jgi:hypothetical protein